MNRLTAMMVAASMAVAPMPASAAPREVVQPVQLGEESVRFDRGEFVIDAVGQRGAVQIRPEESDHGNLSFSVSILNSGGMPVNVDVSNIRIEGTAEPVRVLTRHEMVQKAENRAGWKKVLVAIGGGLAAASMASQRNYYSATTFTPFRTYHTVIDAPCRSCQVAAGATLGATGFALDRIQGRLDATRRELGEAVLQMTTLHPGESYGGRIFLTRFKRKPMSEMRLIVRVNEEDYVFGFRFAKPGTPPPAYRMAPVRAPSAVTLAVAVPIPPATSEARYQTIASTPLPVRTAPPVPRSAAHQIRPAASAADDARSDTWRRYYAGLRENGMSEGKARAQADRVIGFGL